MRLASVEGKRTEVESSTGLVDGDAVDNHFVVVGFAAAHEQGREASALAGGVHYGAGKKADGIVGGRRAHGFQLAAFQGGNAGAGFFGESRGSGRGDDYGFRGGGEVELDCDDVGTSGDIFGLRCEAGGQDLDLIVTGGNIGECADSFGGGRDNSQQPCPCLLRARRLERRRRRRIEGR